MCFKSSYHAIVAYPHAWCMTKADMRYVDMQFVWICLLWLYRNYYFITTSFEITDVVLAVQAHVNFPLRHAQPHTGEHLTCSLETYHMPPAPIDTLLYPVAHVFRSSYHDIVAYPMPLMRPDQNNNCFTTGFTTRYIHVYNIFWRNVLYRHPSSIILCWRLSDDKLVAYHMLPIIMQ